jgi:hypothetical protein
MSRRMPHGAKRYADWAMCCTSLTLGSTRSCGPCKPS